jgi:type II secretory pathway pseudopilin PulG
VRRALAHSGFTFIGVLVLVALVSISLTVASQVWRIAQRRDKEEQLLFVGGQIRRAIARYAANATGGERYPRRMADLLKDPRRPDLRRYLRKLYFDPITGGPEWGLVKSGDFITGVYSLSDDEPVKKTGFPEADSDFEGKTKYSEWIFTAIVVRGRGRGAPSATAPTK